MNANHIIRYLKTDIQELKEILEELQPGQPLSNIELKMLKNRIKSLDEEFSVFTETIQNSKSLENKDNEIKTHTIEKQVSEENSSTENKIEAEQKTIESNTEKITSRSEEKDNKKEQNGLTNSETPTVTQEENKTIPHDRDNQEKETNIQAIANDFEDNLESVSQSSDYLEENTTEKEKADSTSEKKQTIADRFQSNGNSLNDRMTRFAKQKDLASRLAGNPVENLKKAIKLNDRLWYIRELFDGNTQVFQNAMEDLDQMDDLDQALEYLEQNFHFDQEKESFKSFIEIVYRRFIS